MSASDERAVLALIATTCLALDEERFDDYLALYGNAARYRLTTYSPDLRKDLSLLDLNRGELEVLLRNLPRHVRLPGRFMRHWGASLVAPPEDGRFSVTTSILVAHTDLEGVSRLFAAARYRDQVEVSGAGALLVDREVRLDTRQFGPGSHIPL